MDLAWSLAIWTGDLAGVQLFSKQFDVNAPIDATQCAFSGKPHYPLHYASYRGHDTVAHFLVTKGANLTAGDADNDRPLAWAAFGGQTSTVKLLLDLGASAEATNKRGESAFSYATIVEIRQLLGMRHGLGLAIWHGDLTQVRQLVRQGEDVNAPLQCVLCNFAGAPHYPLHYACYRGHDAIVRFLVEQGASMTNGDQENDRPLAWAAYGGQASTVKLMLDLGADDARNKMGVRALDRAAGDDVRRILLANDGIGHMAHNATPRQEQDVLPKGTHVPAPTAPVFVGRICGIAHIANERMQRILGNVRKESKLVQKGSKPDTPVPAVPRTADALHTGNTAQCVVCADAEVHTCFVPCGHLACCEACANAVKSQGCPICRKYIRQVVVTYAA